MSHGPVATSDPDYVIGDGHTERSDSDDEHQWSQEPGRPWILCTRVSFLRDNYGRLARGNLDAGISERRGSARDAQRSRYEQQQHPQGAYEFDK